MKVQNPHETKNLLKTNNNYLDHKHVEIIVHLIAHMAIPNVKIYKYFLSTKNNCRKIFPYNIEVNY